MKLALTTMHKYSEIAVAYLKMRCLDCTGKLRRINDYGRGLLFCLKCDIPPEFLLVFSAQCDDIAKKQRA